MICLLVWLTSCRIPHLRCLIKDNPFLCRLPALPSEQQRLLPLPHCVSGDKHGSKQSLSGLFFCSFFFILNAPHYPCSTLEAFNWACNDKRILKGRMSPGNQISARSFHVCRRRGSLPKLAFILFYYFFKLLLLPAASEQTNTNNREHSRPVPLFCCLNLWARDNRSPGKIHLISLPPSSSSSYSLHLHLNLWNVIQLPLLMDV